MPRSMMPFVDLKAQYQALRPLVQARIDAVLEHGQYIQGPEVGELEQRLAEYTGAKHCIAVASGTEALLISLMALGIGQGDEVITTPFTFAATAETIVLTGAKPVFVDVEMDTGNIDAALIEGKITERTRAIMPVSLYGQVADMGAINAIAARCKNVAVIEDAAQSFGAEYNGKKSCNLSDVGCTSFFPSKPLGCYGDGGAIFSNIDEFARICREIRVHGQSRRYVHERLGVGGRMDTLQCAIVLAKFERFDWEISRRIELGQRYNQKLDAIGITRIQQRGNRSSVFAQYTVLTEKRDMMQNHLKEMGIPTAVHYPVPLNDQPAYRQFANPSSPTPNAEELSRMVMSLPISADLTHEQQDHVVAALAKLTEKLD